MVDAWRAWDEAMRQAPVPEREAARLTDEQLLAMLASEDPGRRAEKRIVRDELHARLAAARSRRGDDPAARDTVEDAFDMEPAVSPAPPEFRDFS